MTSSLLPNSCTNIQDLNYAIRPSKECGKNIVYYRTSHPNGWQEPNNIRLMHVHDGTNCTGVCKLDFLCDGNLIGSINITGNCEEPQENNQTKTEESSSESSDGSSQESSDGSSSGSSSESSDGSSSGSSDGSSSYGSSEESSEG